MTKDELRAEYRQKRALLNPEAVSALSQQIADRFFADVKIQQSLAEPYAVLHTFLPIRRQNEADTWFIVRRVWAEYPHVRVLSSITDTATRSLTAFDLRPDTALTENRWDIPEPATPPKPVLQSPTLVLVPLLAFDLRGHRVGYGGGYYDHFLTKTGPDCLKVGLSFFPPVSLIDNPEPTDICLQGFVCPDSIYWV